MKVLTTINLYLILLLATACTLSQSDRLPAPFKVIPQPREIEFIKGKGLKYGELSGIILEGLEDRPVMGNILSRIPMGQAGTKSILTLILNTQNPEIQNPEGYSLTITGGEARIESSGLPGIFYGCQTLEQLLEDARDYNTSIPSCKIKDYPSLAFRAVHFDVKHHQDHMNYYYNSIDRLARYKINAIIFEVEDKLRYAKQPLVAAPQAISIDEMSALTRYATERNIEISPLVQGLGHATFILKHPEYHHIREIPNRRWVSCSMDDRTYEIYDDLFCDAFKATPGSRYVHIGGDEIGDVGLCYRCKEKGEEIGELGLYLLWLNRICAIAHKYGRIPIFWDDMPLKMAGVYESTWNTEYDMERTSKDWERGGPYLDKLIQNFPENCVYMRWNYESGKLPGNINAIEWYRKNNLPVLVATAAQTGSLLFPKDERTGSMSDGGLAAIQSFLQVAREHNANGMLCTAWDDNSPHMETYWRGFIASAEYSWSSAGPSLSDFDQAFLQKEFGLREDDYYSMYETLTDAAAFWGKAFMRNGDRSDLNNALLNLPGLAHWIPEAEKEKQQQKTDFSDVVIDLPDPKNAGSWASQYENRLNEAERIIDNYSITSRKIENLYDHSRRNRYHWRLFKALNDFQVTAPRLLLALKQCDTPDVDKRRKGIKEVEDAINGFNQSWEMLMSVYAETRFIAYPDNYVSDRYFHFASQREDLSWMIQAEELVHDQIIEWMQEN